MIHATIKRLEDEQRERRGMSSGQKHVLRSERMRLIGTVILAFLLLRPPCSNSFACQFAAFLWRKLRNSCLSAF